MIDLPITNKDKWNFNGTYSQMSHKNNYTEIFWHNAIYEHKLFNDKGESEGIELIYTKTYK